MIKLKGIADIYTGTSINETIKETKYTGISNGLNYIATKDINFDCTVNYENGVKIPETEEGFDYAYPNSVLLCIEGGSAGRKIAIINQKVCFGNELCNFTPIYINNKFLYYYLQNPLFLNHFKNNLSGIISGVSLNKIKEISIVFPPIEEQQRIVEQLDKLLPLCETL